MTRYQRSRPSQLPLVLREDAGATHDALARLTAGDEADRIAALQLLALSDSRAAWAAIAGAYLSTEKAPAVRDAAQMAMRRIATRYRTGLVPFFHIVPWADYILSDEEFVRIYERTRDLTSGLRIASPTEIVNAIAQYPRSLLIFRLILGYTVKEFVEALAVVEVAIGETTISRLENADALSSVRTSPPSTAERIGSLASVIYGVVERSLMRVEVSAPDRYRSRMEKADTRDGWSSVARFAASPMYAYVLYERYTGRPFAYVRDAVSEGKGDLLEAAVARVLDSASITYHWTSRGGNVAGWDHQPDFLIPSAHTPHTVVEVSVVEDGGSAYKKEAVMRETALQAHARGTRYVAVIDGIGWRRINDALAPLLVHAKGLVFSTSNLRDLPEYVGAPS